MSVLINPLPLRALLSGALLKCPLMGGVSLTTVDTKNPA